MFLLSLYFMCDHVHAFHKPNTPRAALLELSFWSSMSVLWLNGLWWGGGRGGEDVSCLCCSRGKFNLIWAVVSTLACRSQATSPTLAVVEQSVRGGGEEVCREGTETGFCSIMHNNNSQRPVVYCGKLPRLWPKWFGHKENFWCLLGQTLKTLHDYP